MNTNDLPVSLSVLFEFLTARGFQVAREQSGGMGGLDIFLAGSIGGTSGAVSAFVNFNGDRGRWSVALKLGAMSRWTTAGEWKAYFDGASMERMRLDEQVLLIKERFGEMVDVSRGDPNIERALLRIGEEYMRRQLGQQ